MAEEKRLRARVAQKRGSYSDWDTAGKNGFTPLPGEIIIYTKEDKNENGETYQRYPEDLVKIGDGVTTVDKLLFDRGIRLYLTDESAPENALTGTFKVVPSTDAVIDANNGSSDAGSAKLYRHDIHLNAFWMEYYADILFSYYSTDPTPRSRSVVTEDGDWEYDEETGEQLKIRVADVDFIPTDGLMSATGFFDSADGNRTTLVTGIKRNGGAIEIAGYNNSDEFWGTSHQTYWQGWPIVYIEEIIDTVTEVM